MNQAEYLLTQFDEELKELSIECLRAGIRVDKMLRFGAWEVQPGHDWCNNDRLMAEIVDVLGMIETLLSHGILQHPDFEKAIQEKIDKIQHFMSLSREQGTLTGEHNDQTE